MFSAGWGGRGVGGEGGASGLGHGWLPYHVAPEEVLAQVVEEDAPRGYTTHRHRAHHQQRQAGWTYEGVAQACYHGGGPCWVVLCHRGCGSPFLVKATPPWCPVMTWCRRHDGKR
jgi:hypothetical protein